MLRAMRRGGKLSRADLDTRLGEWTRAWERRLPRLYHGYIWIYGHTGTVETREGAVASLAAAEKYAPLPWYRPGLVADGLVGRVYLVAGRAADAVPLLERATKQCKVLDDPFTQVESFGWLGAAREATGDKSGACAAYGELVRRWKTAPQARSLRDAKGKLASLGCR
jgi:hypothetical protein